MIYVSCSASILAYACGHPSCWPDGMDKSTFRVCTAKELGDHCKDAHRGNMNNDCKPFRCGLCDNRWKVGDFRLSSFFKAHANSLVKNLNGLMYHLQVYVSSSSVCPWMRSPTHFPWDYTAPERIFSMQSRISHLPLARTATVRLTPTPLWPFVLHQPKPPRAKKTPERRLEPRRSTLVRSVSRCTSSSAD